MLNKAIEIAAKAHSGQVDKGGQPYILHSLRVMLNCEREQAKICAVLHDVVEDTTITPDILRKNGFSEDIISTLDCLTKRDDENYDEFISRVLENETACWVKMADLCDNMDLSRITNPTEKDKERVEKYLRAAERISQVLPNANNIADYRSVEISGMVEIQPFISIDQFSDIFLQFVESHGWFFGGGFKDVKEENSNE